MRLVYINNIPHWTDGSTTLPFISGGQLTDEEIQELFGGVQTLVEGEDKPLPLGAWRGRQLYNPLTGSLGTLQWRENKSRRYRDPMTNKWVTEPGGRTYWLSSTGGRLVAPVRSGDTLLDPTSLRVLILGTEPGGTGTGIVSSKFASRSDLERWGLTADQPGSTGVSADTAASIASRERIAREQQAAELAFLKEQERLRNIREQELERIRAENALKRQKLGEAGALARTAAEVQQRARQLIAELTGVDPIRGAVAAQGGVPRGTTPAQAFTSQLQGIATAGIPTVGMDASIPEIEETIAALEGQQEIPVAPSLGFAHGGTIDLDPGMETIDMEQGADGAFAPALPPPGLAPGAAPITEDGTVAAKGTTKRAILVGEGNPDGDEEVVIMDSANPGHVEVIPLVAGAAGGGEFDFSTIQQSLAPIFQSLGFTDYLPTASRSIAGTLNIHGGYGSARRLGIKPRLVRRKETGQVFWLGPDEVWHHVSSPTVFKKSGFDWRDVLNIKTGSTGGIPIGSQLTSPPSILEGPVRRFPVRGVPIAGQVGKNHYVLPDPRLIAGIWRFLDPQTRNVLVSAYGTAGFGTPQEARNILEDEIGFFTPGGTARSARSATLG